jgi:hypothetical protein
METVYRLVNLTMHDISVSKGDIEITYPRSKSPLRFNREDVVVGTDELGIPIMQTVYKPDEKTNLPDVVPGTYYIVSKYVAEAFIGRRSDFLSPATNMLLDDPEFIYQEDGFRRVKSVKQFRIPGTVV